MITKTEDLVELLNSIRDLVKGWESSRGDASPCESEVMFRARNVHANACCTAIYWRVHAALSEAPLTIDQKLALKALCEALKFTESKETP